MIKGNTLCFGCKHITRRVDFNGTNYSCDFGKFKEISLDEMIAGQRCEDYEEENTSSDTETD